VRSKSRVYRPPPDRSNAKVTEVAATATSTTNQCATRTVTFMTGLPTAMSSHSRSGARPQANRLHPTYRNSQLSARTGPSRARFGQEWRGWEDPESVGEGEK